MFALQIVYIFFTIINSHFQVDGNVFMVYNMGTEDHPIGELSVNVNDHQYHVVRFTRSGPNSTIQIDDHNVRTKQPTGK